MHVIPQAIGDLDTNNMKQIAALEQKCEEKQTTEPAAGGGYCSAIMDYIGTVSGGVFKFDSRRFGYDWTPGQHAVSDMLKHSGRVQEIYAALHISASTKKPVFDWSAAAVKAALTEDALRDYSQYYNYLITENFPLLVMVGEYDMLDGYMGQTLWMKETLHTVDKDFWV